MHCNSNDFVSCFLECHIEKGCVFLVYVVPCASCVPSAFYSIAPCVPPAFHLGLQCFRKTCRRRLFFPSSHGAFLAVPHAAFLLRSFLHSPCVPIRITVFSYCMLRVPQRGRERSKKKNPICIMIYTSHAQTHMHAFLFVC